MPTKELIPKRRVIELARQGVAARAIARRLAVSRGAVYAVLRQEVAKCR